MFNLGVVLGVLIGIVIGAIASVGYFSYTGSTLKWKK